MATRVQLYVCGVRPTAEEGILELTAAMDESGRYSLLQFTAKTTGEATITFPAIPGPRKGNFFFSNTNGPDGYLVSIRFKEGDKGYRLYSVSNPANPNDESDAGGGYGGLVITEANGTDRKISCGEAVYEFVSAMRDAMSCDVDVRYGSSFCDSENVPLRVQDDFLP